MRRRGPGCQRQRHGDERSEKENRLVGASRNHRLLEDELQKVGERLEQTPRTDHVRAAAHLHGSPDLAVGVQNVGDEKAVLRSMNSGQLPRCIDQNQTPDSAREESTIQSQIQTLRGEMLLVGVNLQGGIDTDNYAFCDGHDGTRGVAQNSKQSRRRD